MQILGKKSKILLIAVAIAMLVAVGVSFATWDSSAVKSTSGDLSSYANAKVGDVITFGEYYQTAEKDPNDSSEYAKTPIEWIVVDKDERCGQLTLMSMYILACGSYFGNWYHDGIKSDYAWNYSGGTSEVGDVAYNQAYVDSTARAFLNNLERLDMGGDSFDTTNGYIPSALNSSYDKTVDGSFIQGTGLLSSVGFSNQRYWTKLTSTTPGVDNLLANPDSGLFKRKDMPTEVYFQRPITNDEYKARPVTRGFLDEAFSYEEKSMIVPKPIAGYTGHRWPDNAHDIATKSYIEGTVDKVWLPSATELNVEKGQDWNSLPDDAWTNPSDDASSTVFEYFKNFLNYTNPVTKTKNTSVAAAIKTQRTTLAKNGMVGNYSIPVYDKGTTTPKTEISVTANTSDHYWTRSPRSSYYTSVRGVTSSGSFDSWGTNRSHVGVRPCVMLKY